MIPKIVHFGKKDLRLQLIFPTRITAHTTGQCASNVNGNANSETDYIHWQGDSP